MVRVTIPGRGKRLFSSLKHPNRMYGQPGFPFKFTLVQAMKAQRGSGDIAVPFL